ncbi:hypothetical protein [Streptomyces sp. NPDC058622]|uniref:hypothetical protein n=1 Tax=unclassified Streptomyces TaxID=2593676 RepID=UPI003663E72A
MVTVRRDAAFLVSEGRLGRVHGSLVWPGDQALLLLRDRPECPRGAGGPRGSARPRPDRLPGRGGREPDRATRRPRGERASRHAELGARRTRPR